MGICASGFTAVPSAGGRGGGFEVNPITTGYVLRVDNMTMVTFVVGIVG